MPACRVCKTEVAEDAKSCPNCGIRNPAPKPKSKGPRRPWRWFMGLFAAYVIAYCSFYGPTQEEMEAASAKREAEGLAEQEAERAKAAAEKAERRRKGFHCLSTWDGAHRKAVALIKDNLNDPGSFDHVETLVSPVNSDGTHWITIKFRANNVFGALMSSEAKGSYRQSDCEVVSLSFN